MASDRFYCKGHLSVRISLVCLSLVLSCYPGIAAGGESPFLMGSMSTALHYLIPQTSQNKESQQVEKAIPLLKHIFQHSKNPEEKRDAALLLVSFGPGTSTYAERAIYGRFLLTDPDSTQVLVLKDSLSRTRLLKEVGTAWFSQGRWEDAHSSFKELSLTENPEYQSLAQLYLGWIEVNQKKPELAIQRWLSFMKTREGILAIEWQTILLKSMGQIWIENGSLSSLMTQSLSSILPEPVDQEAFKIGIAQWLLTHYSNLEKQDPLGKSALGIPLSTLISEAKLPLSKKEFIPISYLFWSSLTYPNEKEAFLLRHFSDPHTVEQLNNQRPILWWLSVLSSKSNNLSESPTIELVRSQWRMYFLSNPAILANLALKSEEKWTLLFKMSLEANLFEPLWNHLSETQIPGLKSLPIEIYHEWLARTMELYFLDKLTLDSAPSTFCANSYYEVTRFLKSVNLPYPPRPHEKLTQARVIFYSIPTSCYEKSRYLKSVKLFIDSLELFRSSSLLKLETLTVHSVSQLKLKLRLAQRATQKMRLACSLTPPLNELFWNSLSEQLEGLKAEILAVTPFKLGSEEDESRWNEERTALIESIAKWGKR